MKKRVLLRVAYDGTNYHGWQVQQGAVTIEQVLNEKLTELLGEPIEVIGASRTDSGVHAPGRHPHSVIYGSGAGLASEKTSLHQNV